MQGFLDDTVLLEICSFTMLFKNVNINYSGKVNRKCLGEVDLALLGSSSAELKKQTPDTRHVLANSG